MPHERRSVVRLHLPLRAPKWHELRALPSFDPETRRGFEAVLDRLR